MKSYFFKRGALLLLVLPMALLRAGGNKTAVLSPEASGIYAQYVKLMSEGILQPPGLVTLMEKNGVDLASVQDLVLLLSQPGFKEQELAPWQREFVLLRQAWGEQGSAAYESLRSQTDALSDAHEKTYLQCLIDYAIFNAKQEILPDSDMLKQALVDLRARLKSVMSGNKYQLSDLYRLYAEVLSRLIPLIPVELMVLSEDSKRFAEQAIGVDKKNGAAYITLGSWYAYAPHIAGGNAEYALELFKQARDLGINNFDLALSWTMSAVAYDRLKQPDMVRHALAQALELHPTHPLSLQYRRKIDNNQPLEEIYFE